MTEPLVFVGQKPLRVYIRAAQANLNLYGTTQLSGRGNQIQRVVILANILTKKISKSICTPKFGEDHIQTPTGEKLVPYLTIEIKEVTQ